MACNTAVARVGSRVRFRDPDGEEELIIVGPEDADPSRGRVSIYSPLGIALLGRQQGDRVAVRAPGGLRQALVLAIEPAPETAGDLVRRGDLVGGG